MNSPFSLRSNSPLSFEMEMILSPFFRLAPRIGSFVIELSTFIFCACENLVVENSTPLEKVKAYLECHERDRVSDQEYIFTKKSNFSWNSIYEILIPYFDNI